jgi:heme exporter protein CcmD
MMSFLSMGDYTVYVWGAWGVSLMVLMVLVWQPHRKRKQLEKQLFRQIAREVIMMQSKPE